MRAAQPAPPRTCTALPWLGLGSAALPRSRAPGRRQRACRAAALARIYSRRGAVAGPVPTLSSRLPSAALGHPRLAVHLTDGVGGPKCGWAGWAGWAIAGIGACRPAVQRVYSRRRPKRRRARHSPQPPLPSPPHPAPTLRSRYYSSIMVTLSIHKAPLLPFVCGAGSLYREHCGAGWGVVGGAAHRDHGEGLQVLVRLLAMLSTFLHDSDTTT